jgi:hypothetical protein
LSASSLSALIINIAFPPYMFLTVPLPLRSLGAPHDAILRLPPTGIMSVLDSSVIYFASSEKFSGRNSGYQYSSQFCSSILGPTTTRFIIPGGGTHGGQLIQSVFSCKILPVLNSPNVLVPDF